MPLNDSDIRKRLEHLARKHGGANLVWAAATVLATAQPNEVGIKIGHFVPIEEAIQIVLSLAERRGCGEQLRTEIESGEMRMWCQEMWALSDGDPADLELGIREPDGRERGH
jgi:hypothetical protein